MQRGKWRYIVSNVTCLFVALYLSGCGGGAGGGMGGLQSTLSSINGMTGASREFQNNAQMLMMKLNTYASITEEGLQNAHVSQLLQQLQGLSQSLTNGMGGMQVENAVKNIYLRMPPMIQPYWTYVAIPMITLAINVQASYLNVALQYMIKNATMIMPDEMNRLNTVLTSALATFNTVGI